jgi:large subunit ribosomal protein L32e
MIAKRKKPRFLRRDWKMKPRFWRKKKMKWRAAKGRHNKIREKKKNRPRMPSIGYGSPREIRGLVKGLNPVYIANENDLSKVGKDDIAILSSTLGRKKKIEIAEKAKGIKFLNFNPEKLLNEIKMEKEKRMKKEEKPEEKKKEEKKKEKEKKEIRAEEKKS